MVNLKGRRDKEHRDKSPEAVRGEKRRSKTRTPAARTFYVLPLLTSAGGGVLLAGNSPRLRRAHGFNAPTTKRAKSEYDPPSVADRSERLCRWHTPYGRCVRKEKPSLSRCDDGLRSLRRIARQA